MAGIDTDVDSVMRRLEEGRQLPWRLVNHGTLVKLANKLDIQSPVSNNDWKGLAEHLGFTTENILVLEQSKDRNTLALFYNYLPKKDATVNNVAKALKLMNREDVLDILLDAVPDIEARFDRDPQNSTMEGVEGDDTCTTTMLQGGCRCLRSPTSLHGAGGACCPCNPHSHHLRHHHPHPQVQCSLTSGSCCCHHMGTMQAGHCHTTAPAPLAAFSSFEGQGPSSLLSSSFGCRGMVSSAGGTGGRGGGLISNNYNIHVEANNYSTCSGGRGRDMFPRTTQAHLVGAGRSSLRQHALPSLQPHASPLHQQQHYADLPVSSYSPLSDSLQVHHHAESRQQRLDTFTSTTSTNEPMELDRDGGGNGRRGEEPALLHTAIARGEGLLSGGLVPMEIGSAAGDTAGGDDTTPSTSVEELSSSDSGSRLPLNVVERQESEECNAKQPFFVGTPASSLIQSSAAKHNGTDSMAATWAACSGNVGHQVTAGGPSQSSLKQLETLSQSLGSFKPDPQYTRMVAEQKVEESVPGAGGNHRRQIKRERGGGDCTAKMSGPPSSSSSDSSRSGAAGSISLGTKSGRDTFPMRVKPQAAGGATVEQVRSRPPGMLTKTTSVPMDMKVEEFKKAFRHIKVFVTYANDSKLHRKQVLSLCNCLDRNGFSCCVDVSPRHDSPNELQNCRDWCSRKFKEADFVVVCLSSLYLQEIQCGDNTGKKLNRMSKGLLHVAFIYQLMKEEYQATGLCSRFVALHMEGAPCESVPSWLTSHLSYRWPQQYKDLLWMLTKPEERIKQRSRSSPSKGHGKVNGLHSPNFLS